MTEPQNVKLSGPGIAKTLPASFPAEFTIDAKNAGYGRPEVKIQVKMQIKLSNQSLFFGSYNQVDFPINSNSN